MSARVITSAMFLALFAAVAVKAYAPHETESVYCVVIPGCYTPKYSYYGEYAADEGQCCAICANDDKCVAWTFNPEIKFCALKDSTEVLVLALGVTTGVKKYSYESPVIDDNVYGAYVLFGKPSIKPYYPPEPVNLFGSFFGSLPFGGGRSGSVNSASASAVSTGGHVSSSAISTPGLSSVSNSVHGTGTAAATVSNGRISFKLVTKSKYGEPPESSYLYFKHPKITGHILFVSGENIPIVINKKDEPLCYTCDDFPCSIKNDLAYELGEVLSSFEVENEVGCCFSCRHHAECISWFVLPDTKICVLNKNLPEPKHIQGSYCGSVV